MIIGIPGVAYLCMEEQPHKERNKETLSINHFGFALKDFDQALEILQNNEVGFVNDRVIHWERSRSVYIQDPNGHLIELSEKVGGGLK